jgi:hippurate hydrolase
VTESEGVPALANDEALADRLGSLFRGLLGADHVQTKERSMGFEDFSQFGNAGIPITMFGVGSVSQERLDQYREQGGIPSLHSATYYPDAEDTLRTAFQTLTAATLDLFESDPLADRANP